MVILILYLLMKDHKKLGERGLPKTRPVCAASDSLNQELSEWVSEILEAVNDSEEQNDEAVSTEDMISEIDALNKKWEREGEKITSKNTFIGSLDAAALYPSLDTRR